MYDDRKKARREMRQFELGDYVFALILGAALCTFGITAADKIFHIFEGLETQILHLDFSGPIELFVRALTFFAGFLLGLMLHKTHRENTAQ